jgi:carbon storage regulator
MLVLSRKRGEQIIVDGDIEVTIVEISGDRVRLGVNAPPSVRVDRREIHERRVKELRAACAAAATS